MSALPSGYHLSNSNADMQADVIHAYLTTSYWASGISLDIVRKSILGSICVGIFHDDNQVAFARLITDQATFAYLADVFVLENHRGQGLSKVLLTHLHSLPELQDIRRWALFTQDAQSLYAQFDWQEYQYPERFMVRDFPGVYT
mgnify:FL=1